MSSPESKFPYTWEEAIQLLRTMPQHAALIRDAYLTDDLIGNCSRFFASREFKESLDLLRRYSPNFKTLMDMPGGNGIATVAFAKSGCEVTAVEPNPSNSVGRGAIEFALHHAGLSARVISAFGEDLPLDEASFDVVYVRQGLHHAQNLPLMLSEITRVLKKGGLLLATREHVVDDYGASLRAFLDSQVDHQLYGGEHAFTLADYRAAIDSAGLARLMEIGPYDSPINLYPNDEASLCAKIIGSFPGKLLSVLLPERMVARIGMWQLRRANLPGRLFSFLAQKAA